MPFLGLFLVEGAHAIGLHQLYQTMLANLRAARASSGMRQVDVAKALKRPQSFVSNCESGERRVDAVELLEFARLYERPLSDFIPDR